METDVKTNWIHNPTDNIDLAKQYARAIRYCNGNDADIREVEAERTFFKLCLDDESFCISEGLIYLPPRDQDMISLEEFEAEPHFINSEPAGAHSFWTIVSSDETDTAQSTILPMSVFGWLAFGVMIMMAIYLAGKM